MALHLLGELDDEVVALGLVAPQRYHLVRLLSATRRQLWFAVAAIEGPHRRRRAAQRQGLVLAVDTALRSVLRFVAFLIRSAWRSTLALLRLIYVVGTRA